MKNEKLLEIERYANLYGVSIKNKYGGYKDLAEVLMELSVIWSNMSEELRITTATIVDNIMEND